MIVLIRRVVNASVSVSNEIVASIDKGLLLYVGIAEGDTEKECDYYAKKVAGIRIFENPNDGGKELSVLDIGGGILSVSQFTLSADTKKGNRPSYIKAMHSSKAKPLFDYFNAQLENILSIKVATGVFGADMKITATDDGPFTIILSPNK